MVNNRRDPILAPGRARAIAGHVVMALALGWDVQRASVRDRKPWAKKYVTREQPTVDDDFAEAFVLLAGPLASGELEGLDLTQRAPDRDVEHARTLASTDDFPAFVDTVRRVLDEHAAAVDRFAKLLDEGDIDATSIEAALRDLPELRGTLQFPAALVPRRGAAEGDAHAGGRSG
jgi:hypothetical protein